jgi:hypothetical protein
MSGNSSQKRVGGELGAGGVVDGHALGNKVHEADRWIAAPALRIGIPFDLRYNGRRLHPAA